MNDRDFRGDLNSEIPETEHEPPRPKPEPSEPDDDGDEDEAARAAPDLDWTAMKAAREPV